MSRPEGFPITCWSTVNALGTTTQEVVCALREGRQIFSQAPETAQGQISIPRIAAEE